MVGFQPHLLIRAVVAKKDGSDQHLCPGVTVETHSNETQAIQLINPRAEKHSSFNVFFADGHDCPPHIRLILTHKALGLSTKMETFSVDG